MFVPPLLQNFWHFLSVFAQAPLSNPFSNLNLESVFKNSNLNHDVALSKHCHRSPASLPIKCQAVSCVSWFWHTSPAQLCSFHLIADDFVGILISGHSKFLPPCFPPPLPSLRPPLFTWQVSGHSLYHRWQTIYSGTTPLTIQYKLGSLITLTWHPIFSCYHWYNL